MSDQNIHLNERLTNIEKQFKFFSYSINNIKEKFDKGIKISLDEESINITDKLKSLMNSLYYEFKEVRKVRLEFNEIIKSETVTGTLKFMAKELMELKNAIEAIKEDGLQKDIHLAFSMDGYEMVRKSNSIPDDVPDNIQVNVKADIQEKTNPDFQIENKILSRLPSRGQEIFTHLFGLLGHKKKTKPEIAKMYNVSEQRIQQLLACYIYRLNHYSKSDKSFKNDLNKLNHVEFKNAIKIGRVPRKKKNE